MKRTHLLIIAAIVVVAAVGAGVAWRGRKSEALEVQATRVERREIVQTVSATGKIRPRNQVKISADVSAKITKLPVVEGQWVEKGELLVELDRERFVAAVESARANVGASEGNAISVRRLKEQAARELERSKELSSKDMESKSAFDRKQSEHEVQTARHQAALDQVDQAKAALTQALDDLSKTTILAPMAGTISELHKEEGEIALGSQFQADVILVIANLSEMEAQVKVDESDIVSVAIGQVAEIEVDALPDQKLKGIVYEIANSAVAVGAGTSEQKTEFEIKLSITDPPATLRPGMTASAEIVTMTKESALSVPLQCVAVRTVDELAMKGEDRKAAEARYEPDRDGFVEIAFVVENGKAVAKKVATGIQSNDFIEVLEGLKEGDSVVSGSYRAISRDLVNGDEVTVTEKATPAKEEKPGGWPR
jgi:HlyD family secretion protein